MNQTILINDVLLTAAARGQAELQVARATGHFARIGRIEISHQSQPLNNFGPIKVSGRRE